MNNKTTNYAHCRNYIYNQPNLFKGELDFYDFGGKYTLTTSAQKEANIDKFNMCMEKNIPWRRFCK